MAGAEEAPSPPIQAAPEEDPKQVAANSIEPGCAQYTISSWMPKSEKPTHKHLLAAMGEQGSNRIIPEGERKPQPGQWNVQKIADWLHDHAKPAEQVEAQQTESPTQQTAVPSGGSMLTQRWIGRHRVARRGVAHGLPFQLTSI